MKKGRLASLYNSPFLLLQGKGRGDWLCKRGGASLQFSFSLCSFEGKGELIIKEGLTPLLDTPYVIASRSPPKADEGVAITS